MRGVLQHSTAARDGVLRQRQVRGIGPGPRYQATAIRSNTSNRDIVKAIESSIIQYGHTGVRIPRSLDERIDLFLKLVVEKARS